MPFFGISFTKRPPNPSFSYTFSSCSLRPELEGPLDFSMRPFKGQEGQEGPGGVDKTHESFLSRRLRIMGAGKGSAEAKDEMKRENAAIRGQQAAHTLLPSSFEPQSRCLGAGLQIRTATMDTACFLYTRTFQL